MASNSQSILLDVQGALPADPILYVRPTVARASPVANVGWRYRRRATITNTGSEPLAGYPYAIDLGVTTSLVSGSKAQADADDVRLWCNGREVRRTLVDWNQASFSTLVWFVLPYIGAGEVQTWDVMYGNPSAVAAGIPALTLLEDLPAFDIQTAGANRSTNALWKYKVDRVAANAGKGGWGLSSGTAPPATVDFAVPGGWIPTRTRFSNDDVRQEAFSLFQDASVVYYQGRFEARRGPQGTLVNDDDSGTDGVMIRVPTGISAVTATLRVVNMLIGDDGSDVVGQVVMLTRNAPDEAWNPLYSYSTQQDSSTVITPGTQTPPSPVKELAFAVWPLAGDDIDPSTQPDRYVNGAWHNQLDLAIVNTVLTQSVAAEEEVYELATELRAGGGGDTTPVPPYRAVRLGNYAQSAGVDTPRLAVVLGNQVKVDCARRVVEEWNAGLTAKVGDLPIPGYRAVSGIAAADGTTLETVSHDWLPLAPTTNPLTNPDFTANAAGWEYGTVAAGVTTAPISRIAAAGADGATGYGQSNVSASSGGVDAIIEVIASDYLPVGSRESVQVGGAFLSATTAQHGRLAIWWYDQNQAFLSRSAAAAWAELGSSVWERRLFAAAAPAGAIYYRVGFLHVEESASGVADLGFDAFAVNDTEVAILDVASGTLVVRIDWVNNLVYA